MGVCLLSHSATASATIYDDAACSYATYMYEREVDAVITNPEYDHRAMMMYWIDRMEAACLGEGEEWQLEEAPIIR